MINKPTSQKLNTETRNNILKGENQTLIASLLYNDKGMHKIWYIPETEDDKRIYKANNVQTYIYKDKNKADEHMESDRGTEEDTINNIDKELQKEAIQNLKEWTLHRWEVTGIDKYGNSIVSFYEWDIYGFIYKWWKKPLKVGDKKVFKYTWESKKGKLTFQLGKFKRKNEPKKEMNKKIEKANKKKIIKKPTWRHKNKA